MRPPFTAFERLNTEWVCVNRSREARAALARWSGSPALAGAASLDEVLARRAGRDPAGADVVLRALAARCEHDQIAQRTLLQALVPGLVHLAGRVEHGGEDVAGELVSLAWCRLATGGYHRRPGPVAANVLLDVRKYYVRQRRSRATNRPGDPPEARRGEPGRGRPSTVPLRDRHHDMRLLRRGGVLVPSPQTGSAPEEVVDNRDAVVRLFRRAQLGPLTAQILWGRACGVDNAELRTRLGLTRTQPWDHWRRGLAALAACVDHADRAA
ncbi:MAG: hypothetical protein ACRD0A_04455 [Acidimicrobiales bacterium]